MRFALTFPYRLSPVIYLAAALSVAGVGAMPGHTNGQEREAVALQQAPVVPIPQTTPEVGRLLASARDALKREDYQENESLSEQALHLAQKENDRVGEALAHQQSGLGRLASGNKSAAVSPLKSAAGLWGSVAAEASISAIELRSIAAQMEVCGEALWDLNLRPEANRLFLSWLPLHEKGYGRGSRKTIYILIDLGWNARGEGNLTASESFFRSALKLSEANPPDAKTVPVCLLGLGHIELYDRRNLPLGKEWFQKASELLEKVAPDSIEMASCLGGLVMTAETPEQAENYGRRRVAILERLTPGSLGLAWAQANLASTINGRGKALEAEKLLRDALAIRERLAPDSLDVAHSLGALGGFYYWRGDHQSAEEFYLRELALRERLDPGGRLNAWTYQYLSYIARNRGDWEQTEYYLRKALAIREKHVPNTDDHAFSINEIGELILHHYGKPEIAEGYFLRALAIWEKTSPKAPVVGYNWINLGKVALSRGQDGKAEEYFRRADAHFREVVPDSIILSDSISLLGNVYFRRGDLVNAETHFREALSLRERLAPDSMPVAWSLTNLASVASSRRDIGTARRLYARAWEIFRREALQVVGDEGRLAYGRRVSIGDAYLRTLVASGDTQMAFRLLEQFRAQAQLRIMAERKTLTGPAYTAYVQAHREKESVMAVVSGKASTLSQLQNRKKRANAIAPLSPEESVRLDQEITSAEKALAAAHQSFTATRVQLDSRLTALTDAQPNIVPPTLTSSQAQRTLAPGAVYIAFTLGAEEGDESLAFVLERERPLKVYRLAGSRTMLLRKITAFREALSNGKALQDPTPAARALFAILFPAPLQETIRNARSILISPDGPLWSVPFSALVFNAGSPARYLGLEKPITCVPSLSVYALIRQKSNTPGQKKAPVTLSVGNPRFSRSEDKTASVRSTARPKPGTGDRITLSAEAFDNYGRDTPLLWGDSEPPSSVPSTGVQARAIAALYGASPLLQEQATEANVRRFLPEANIIHIASHGRFLDTLPMGSGVLLTVPEKKPLPGEHENDGALQAWEFLSMKLKADIAVFGACEVGLGEEIRGEGISGFARALQIAGVHSTIVGLWQVDDQATRDFMVVFHREYRAGKDKDEALRLAMKTVATRNSYRHPYFWAPFLLIGDNGSGYFRP